MKNGDYEGLLLPQVPVEQKWDRQTFLEQTCVKAGMDRNCWKDENTDIFSFTAVVFNEQKPGSASRQMKVGGPRANRRGQPSRLAIILNWYLWSHSCRYPA